MGKPIAAIYLEEANLEHGNYICDYCDSESLYELYLYFGLEDEKNLVLCRECYHTQRTHCICMY